MTTGGGRGAVTWPELIRYVTGVTDQLDKQMTAHDKWHLDRLSAEQQAQSAAIFAKWALVLTAVGTITNIVLGVWLHR